MVGDRKLAGIFAEVADPGTSVVIGIGLNVTLSAEEAGDPVAVSLLDAGVAAPDRDRLVRRLLCDLGTRVVRWREAGGLDEKLIARLPLPKRNDWIPSACGVARGPRTRRYGAGYRSRGQARHRLRRRIRRRISGRHRPSAAP